MDCTPENTGIGEVFWYLFNQAFKEANKANYKYFPQRWVSNIASSNFNCSVQLYVDEVWQKIKAVSFAL